MGRDGGVGGRTGVGGGSGGTGGAGGATAYNPCPTNGDPCKDLAARRLDHPRVRVDRRWRLSLAALQADPRREPEGHIHRLAGERPHASVGAELSAHARRPRRLELSIRAPAPSARAGLSLVPSPAFDGKPHIVLLHIGTNDTGFMDSANMSTRLESLLDKIAQASPSSLIVLAQITPLGYTSAALTAYNAKIPGIVQSHAAKGQHIVGVDMSKMPVRLTFSQTMSTPTTRDTSTWRISGTPQSRRCCPNEPNQTFCCWPRSELLAGPRVLGQRQWR